MSLTVSRTVLPGVTGQRKVAEGLAAERVLIAFGESTENKVQVRPEVESDMLSTRS